MNAKQVAYNLAQRARQAAGGMRLVGLLAFGAAIVLTAAACGSSGPARRGGGNYGGMGPGMMGSRNGYVAPTSQASSTPGGSSSVAARVQLTINPPPAYGLRAPDGQVHDAFVPATFTMKANETVQVTVLNYDDMPHSWTAPNLGVNVNIPAGSHSSPSRTTFDITPAKPGVVQWFCAIPCDAWSMAHSGFMQGTVTVTA